MMERITTLAMDRKVVIIYLSIARQQLLLMVIIFMALGAMGVQRPSSGINTVSERCSRLRGTIICERRSMGCLLKSIFLFALLFVCQLVDLLKPHAVLLSGPYGHNIQDPVNDISQKKKLLARYLVDYST